MRAAARSLFPGLLASTDREEPLAKSEGLLELFSRTPGSQHGFLRQVLGDGVVTAQPVRQPHDLRAQGLQLSLECQIHVARVRHARSRWAGVRRLPGKSGRDERHGTSFTRRPPAG